MTAGELASRSDLGYPFDMRIATSLSRSVLTLGLATLAALLPPVAARAHPHVFVDTGLALVLNANGEVEAIDVTWAYDDLYSLLVLQDMGLDDDGDGVLTQAEQTRLHGWDMQWIDGYEGDLYLTDPSGAPIPLSGPTPLATTTENARIVTRHRRHLDTPLAPDGLVLRAYDPEFYTAYDLRRGVEVPTSCTADTVLPDQDAAYADAQEVMAAFPEDAVDVPLLGHIFAETVTVTCASAD